MLAKQLWQPVSAMADMERASKAAFSASLEVAFSEGGSLKFGLVLLRHTVLRWLGWPQWAQILPYVG